MPVGVSVRRLGDASLADRLEYFSIPEPNSGCILWFGAATPEGYGKIRIAGGYSRVGRAHRFAWEAVNGPIPGGLDVMHKCDVPACINPAHMKLGTRADNIADMVAKGRNYRLSRRGNIKLAEDQVIAIRADQRTYKEIAAEYGVSLSSVNNIRQGRTWRKLLPNSEHSNNSVHDPTPSNGAEISPCASRA